MRSSSLLLSRDYYLLPSVRRRGLFYRVTVLALCASHRSRSSPRRISTPLSRDIAVAMQLIKPHPWLWRPLSVCCLLGCASPLVVALSPLDSLSTLFVVVVVGCRLIIPPLPSFISPLILHPWKFGVSPPLALVVCSFGAPSPVQL